MITPNDHYTRRLREILGPRACIGVNNAIGMLAAFPTDDFNQQPFVIAGEEEALIRLAKEKVLTEAEVGRDA